MPFVVVASMGASLLRPHESEHRAHATYLELTLRQHLPLATLDTALMRAAKAEGVKVIGEAT